MLGHHLPGPWRVVLAYGYRVEAGDGTVVARIPTHAPLTWQTPANAYLIAAAPDLLRACERALDMLGSGDDLPAIRQVLQEAIIAARGQSAPGWMPGVRIREPAGSAE